jgi:pyridoxine 4-dehydrogenase
LMFALPMVGWAMLSAGHYPIVMFGPVHLPAILPASPPLYAVLRKTHTILAYLLFLAFLAHLSAVLFHTLIVRDHLLNRMAVWRVHFPESISQAKEATPMMTKNPSAKKAETPVPTFLLGGDLKVNRMGYGAMQLTGAGVWGDAPRREEAKRVLAAAVEGGVNFIDTADAYGPETNEILIQEALHEDYGKLVIATKGGFERPGPGQWVINGRPEHIRQAIDGSLRRLQRDQIDLWQLHRFDPKVPVEETLGPVVEAVKAGKIKHVGLSEVDVAGIERAEKVLPIVSVQNLYNLGDRSWEEVLDYTARRNMAFIPWFPLASGPDKMRAKLGAIAQKHRASVAQIALAWLLKRSPNILLIPGTSSPQHLRENLAAIQIELSDEDFSMLSK